MKITAGNEFLRMCWQCGDMARYSGSVFDSFYCAECNIWLEPECGDADCEMCSDRPEMPSQTAIEVKR